MFNDLDKFLKKMKKESIIKSLICGISSALLMVSLLIILCKVIPLRIIIWLDVVLFVVFCGGFSYLFFKYVFTYDPTKVAQRLEKNAPLQERVKTMVEFDSQDSPMINLQRKDTNERLKALPVSTLKMKFSFSNFVMTILAGLALTGAILIPPSEVKSNAANPSDSISNESSEISESSSDLEESSDKSDGGSEESSGSGEGEENNNQGINDAIDDMQQEVNDNTGLDDNSKDDINQDLDDLRDNLTNPDSNEDSGDQIDQTKENINEKLDDQITKDEIGEALKNQDTTKELGENVSNGDTEQTNNSLDDLRESLKDLTGDELKDALNKIAEDIDNALQESNVDSSDPLYQAFENLSNNLKDNAEHTNDQDIQDQIDSSFEQAKNEIGDALDNQNAIEDLKNSLNQKLDDLKDQLEDNSQDDNNPDDSGDPNDNPGENNGPGSGASEGTGDIIYASDDLIYNPVTDSYVTYGEIIAYYYSQVIQGMDESEIPENLESLIYDYFSSLYFDGNN